MVFMGLSILRRRKRNIINLTSRDKRKADQTRSSVETGTTQLRPSVEVGSAEAFVLGKAGRG
jgi:hypothetical protein